MTLFRLLALAVALTACAAHSVAPPPANPTTPHVIAEQDLGRDDGTAQSDPARTLSLEYRERRDHTVDQCESVVSDLRARIQNDGTPAQQVATAALAVGTSAAVNAGVDWMAQQHVQQGQATLPPGVGVRPDVGARVRVQRIEDGLRLLESATSDVDVMAALDRLTPLCR